MNFEIVNPTSIKELLSEIKKLQKKNFRLAAGCTDLLLELKKNPIEDLTVINLTQITDNLFYSIKKTTSGLWIGAGVTASQIVNNEEIRKNYYTLYNAALNLASTQIRQVATVGGNICTASPSGDIACALVALESDCEIININGKKKRVSIKDFFVGPRKTIISKKDILYGVLVPMNKKGCQKIYSDFIKIGTRKSMECSVVSLASHIQVDKGDKIVHVGFAIGASAPTIRFIDKSPQFLVGKKIITLSTEDIQSFASLVLSYASPITDIRATAWYRREVLFNISKSIFENIEQ